MIRQVRLEFSVSGYCAHATDNKQGDEHEDTSVEEQRSSTESAHDEEGSDDTENLDTVDNDSDDESVLETNEGEERSCVREDELDSGDLLRYKDTNSCDELSSFDRVF